MQSNFWATVIPLAFGAIVALPFLIFGIENKIENLRTITWWLAYSSVILIVSGLFATILSGLRFLSGEVLDAVCVKVAIFSLCSYVLAVVFVPLFLFYNKNLASRYPISIRGRNF